MNLLVSVRGHFNAPTFLLIYDLDKPNVEFFTYKQLNNWDQIPNNKRGFAGIKVHGNNIYATTWDRFCVFSSTTLDLVEEILHPYFSDLHGFCIQDGKAYVANTNLDMIQSIDIESKEVNSFWAAWDSHPKHPRYKTKNALDIGLNFNKLNKHQSPFPQPEKHISLQGPI